MSRRPAALAVLLLAPALLAGCTSSSSDDAGPTAPSTDVSSVQSTLLACPDQPDTPASGDQLMPDLSFDCIGGGSVDFGRAQGVPTVVNLWASWCGPCREELPLMQQLSDAAAGRVQVIGVVSTDSLTQATSFAEGVGVTIPGAFDEQGDLAAELGRAALPVTYLLDADGAVAFTQIEPIQSLDELEQLVADHLGVQL